LLGLLANNGKRSAFWMVIGVELLDSISFVVVLSILVFGLSKKIKQIPYLLGNPNKKQVKYDQLYYMGIT